MSTRFIGRLLVAVVLFAVLSEMSWAKEGKRPAKEVASAMWERIANAKPDPETVALRDKWPGDYWAPILIECERAFLTIDQADDHDAVLEYFVDQFGKHGPDADMRWLFVGTYYTLPANSFPPRGKVSKAMLDTGIKMSELITRRCLKDEDFLSRYHRVMVWDCGFFSHTTSKGRTKLRSIKYTTEGFERPDKAEYWWYARYFVLLAHAFNRDDLLKGVAPEELDKVYPSFLKWYEENHDFMEVDKENYRWKLNEHAKKKGIRNKRFPRLPRLHTPFSDWPKDGPKSRPPNKLLFRFPSQWHDPGQIYQGDPDYRENKDQ